MIYKILVILHLLGATVWIGGHLVLVSVVLPGARRRRDPDAILAFERGYGRLGIGALALQLVTGLWLATFWIGDWSTLLADPTPAARLAMAKLTLLVITVIIAIHADRRVLPRLTPERIRAFTIHAHVVTALAVLMLVVGASIRLGGPL